MRLGGGGGGYIFWVLRYKGIVFPVNYVIEVRFDYDTKLTFQVLAFTK